MYKVSTDTYIVDLLEKVQYVRFLPTGHIAFTDKTSAQGFIGSDGITVYSLAPYKQSGYPEGYLSKIDFKEYNKLQKLLKKGATISADETELAKVKKLLLNKMSYSCKQNIISGFTLTLSDTKSYHFKLTIEDQLNLMMIEQQIINGEQTFVYHATDYPCEIFSKEDMLQIIAQAKQHTLYHTTYFNALKQYILKQEDIKVLNELSYGTDISETISDPTIKNIIKRGMCI